MIKTSMWCCTGKNGAITIGLWSLVSSIAQLGVKGWQMVAIKYERDRAANTLLPNYNTYGRFDIPSYYESYFQSPDETFFSALFIIQAVCFVAAFFLAISSVSMIYGVHASSKYFVFPWFICMLSSILISLAYCIMWWCADVRDYWLAITFVEIIAVFINIYCVLLVTGHYRFMSTTKQQERNSDRLHENEELGGEGKRDVRHEIYRHLEVIRSLMESRPEADLRSVPMEQGPPPYQPHVEPSSVCPNCSRCIENSSSTDNQPLVALPIDNLLLDVSESS